ncbi:WD40 repeat domain-containing protein [Jannaschia formosa]|uniref:WD40 repeat domain-containing protein n=1 Tax=Jannaschia formosa TaxID=2259592 RepID=UPI000E1B9D33|nr:WD40 repeat domain-containing protein [Jannaschia formosa]
MPGYVLPSADRFWQLLMAMRAEFGLDLHQLEAAVALHADAVVESLTGQQLAARLTPVFATDRQSTETIRMRLNAVLRAEEPRAPPTAAMGKLEPTRRPALLGAIGATAALAMMLLIWAVLPPSPETSGPESPGERRTPAQGEPYPSLQLELPTRSYWAQPVETPDPRVEQVHLWQIALTTLPFIAIPTGSWLRRRRRSRLGTIGLEDHGVRDGRSLAKIEDPDAHLFRTEPFRATAQALRRHIPVPSRRLDARRTIERTIRHAGLLTPVRGDRLALPEHLVLIERSGLRDHLADLHHLAVARLREDGVQARAFDFWGDPRAIVARPSRSGATPEPMSIESLSGTRRSQRIVVLGSASAFVEPFSERLAPSVEAFEAWDARSVLDPNRPAEPIWSETDMQLPEAGWVIGTTRQDSLSRYAEGLDGDDPFGRLLVGHPDPDPRRARVRVPVGWPLARIRHDGRVLSVAFSPDGARLATGSWDATARLWGTVTGAPLATLKGNNAGVLSVAFSPDGARLATGSADGTARLWDAATGEPLTAMEGHGDWVRSVAFSPDGARLATGSDDRTVRLWDPVTGEQLATLRGHGGAVRSVAFSSNGARLATGSMDGTARLWDAATGEPLATLRGHEGTVYSVAFSPDGARLATGSEDGIARLWDPARGEPLATLEGHGSFVFSVAFSPDGTRLATGADDGTARLWDAATGELLATLEGHGRLVNSVAFSPDGTRLATGADDRTARLWDVATGQELTSISRQVTEQAFVSNP